jgi:hypothetical protein
MMILRIAAPLAAALSLAGPAAALDNSGNVGVGAEAGVDISHSGVSVTFDLGAGAAINLEIDFGSDCPCSATPPGGSGGGSGGGNGGVFGGAFAANGEAAAGAALAAEARLSARLRALIELIKRSDWRPETIGVIAPGLGGAAVVDVKAWLDVDTTPVFHAELHPLRPKIEGLRTAIASSTAIAAWFGGNGIDLGAVLAIGLTADGRLVCFTL